MLNLLHNNDARKPVLPDFPRGEDLGIRLLEQSASLVFDSVSEGIPVAFLREDSESFFVVFTPEHDAIFFSVVEDHLHEHHALLIPLHEGVLVVRKRVQPDLHHRRNLN